jgi:hypothetical protein
MATVGEVDLSDMLARLPAIRWFMARVASVQLSVKAVTMDYRGALIPNTAYLESYTPAVNDVVHVITDQHNGTLILGKEALRPVIPPGTPPAPISVVSTGTGSYLENTAWTTGPLRQGDGWSGAWFYSPTAFTSITVVDEGALEIQLTVPEDTGPLSFVLHGNLDTSAEFVRRSEPWLVQLEPGIQWVSLPLAWVDALIGGIAAGVGLSTDQEVYTATVTGGGTLRFTAL